MIEGCICRTAHMEVMKSTYFRSFWSRSKSESHYREDASADRILFILTVILLAKMLDNCSTGPNKLLVASTLDINNHSNHSGSDRRPTAHIELPVASALDVGRRPNRPKQ